MTPNDSDFPNPYVQEHLVKNPFGIKGVRIFQCPIGNPYLFREPHALRDAERLLIKWSYIINHWDG